jgi:ATP-binding cassette subfamily F protein uup
MSFKEAKELKELPERIGVLEEEQAGLQRRLTEPAMYRDAPDEARRLQVRIAALEGEIAAAMLRWEVLEGRST